MKTSVAAVFVVLVSVAAALPSDPYQPSYKPAPKPYNFAYGVNDPYQGVDFSQTENSDGNTVKGSYSVQLPDGRKKTVNYRADHDAGFHADVSYQGKAQFAPKSNKPPFVVQPSKGGGYAPPQPSYH